MGCIIFRSSEEGEMSSLRCSPAAAVLDDDDLLSEILLRLPPQPSSLPRASLVCKRWRSLVEDLGFIRRFRLRHRRNPPLLGCFVQKAGRLTFLPTMEGPNRVPPGRFSLQYHNRCEVLGCRHGLVLLFDASRKQVLVWDPVTADQHRIAVPTGFDKTVIHGAVLRAAGDVEHFQVVLAATDDKDEQHRQLLACLYSSETGVWGDLVSLPIPSRIPTTSCPIFSLRISVEICKSPRLLGNSLYWLLAGNFDGFLEFDLERQNLTMTPMPVDVYAEGKFRDFVLVRAEDGGLGFIFLSDFTAQLWKRTTDGDGVVSWVPARTIELDKLLPLNSEEERRNLWILEFAEDNNVVFLWTLMGLFVIYLDSLQLKKLCGHEQISWCRPFESVYAAGAVPCVGGREQWKMEWKSWYGVNGQGI